MIPYLSAADVFALLSPGEAVSAVLAALRDGLDPAAGFPRANVPLTHGNLLLMPAESATHAGVKLATVAPDNPSRGLPRIAALYVIFDAETLHPKALIDGTALTTLRTPAVSVAAVSALLPAAPHVVVFGAGPQAVGHVRTLADVTALASVTVVTRTGTLPPVPAWPVPAESGRAGSGRAGSVPVESGRAESGRAESVPVESGRVESGRVESGRVGSDRVGSGRAESVRAGSGRVESVGAVPVRETSAGPAPVGGTPDPAGTAGAFPASVIVHRVGTPEVDAALQVADVVVCATTARTPLFDSALLRETAIVIAVGSHEPDAREVDTALVARATVIVEDRATALRECGDIIMALADGAPGRLLPMSDVIRGVVPVSGGRPVLFKGSGMAWQDLVVAEALLARAPT
ncbi:ornithine cyclodeaminase family protein [Catenuloplanes sp. NPDC051500]|uniref:ornithine cyclodeaminase family protein n=1 Tax=Catenuloplanes sp. NPDC051500 TaxID=3363959 RepID=UPI003798E7B6